jgi:hypothetical protein
MLYPQNVCPPSLLNNRGHIILQNKTCPRCLSAITYPDVILILSQLLLDCYTMPYFPIS